jgi:hypothetical protein
MNPWKSIHQQVERKNVDYDNEDAARVENNNMDSAIRSGNWFSDKRHGGEH